MASITKRGPYQFQAQIRRKGYPTQQRTFESKREAEAWAATVESEMHRGVFVDRSEAERTTLHEALQRYAAEVTPAKRTATRELQRIRFLQRQAIASLSLAALRSADIASYRDARLKNVGAAQVRKELGLLSHVLTVARRDWSLPVENSVAGIRKPPAPRHRERRLEGDEEARLLTGAAESKAVTLSFCVTLALETGMRAGEIVGLQWGQIDLANSVIHLGMTKNGDRRIVPLSEAAEALVRALPRPIHGGRLTGFHDSNGLGAAFRRACERAGITGLRFHDLRHEAASRLAPHMPVATLAKVMGWKTLQMAMRYYNPTAEELVAAVRRAA